MDKKTAKEILDANHTGAYINESIVIKAMQQFSDQENGELKKEIQKLENIKYEKLNSSMDKLLNHSDYAIKYFELKQEADELAEAVSLLFREKNYLRPHEEMNKILEDLEIAITKYRAGNHDK